MADLTRKTANLLNPSVLADGYHLDTTTGLPTQRGSNDRVATLTPIDVSNISAVTLSYLCAINDANFMYSIFDANDILLARVTAKHSGDSIDVSNAAKLYIAFYGNSAVTISSLSQVMLNSGSTALPYEPYGWQHSLRKLTTATEAVENPLYSDGTAITAYTLKGNEEHTGTPSPQNPVMPNGVGVRTENLVESYLSGCNIGSTGVLISNGAYNMFLAKVEQGKTYCLDSGATVGGYYTDIPTVGSTSYNGQRLTFDLTPFTAPIDGYIAYRKAASETTAMMNEGNELKPYEPYGYKIPISTGLQTTNIYLGSTQTVRQIKKLVLTGTEDWKSPLSDNTKFYLDTITPDYLRADSQVTYLCTHYISYEQTTSASLVPNLNISMSSGTAQRLYISDNNFTAVEDFKSYLAAQYANGTPVTVWYALATPETATVNEPLMKIGNYADTLSNAAAIPTTEGANSITVDTTVQPSEFTATWTGWHNATVKEWDGSDWS